ncbi:MAG: hypothetical protein OXF02_05310 [Simkaniaceae bacterium]|nr:hypothetical protein [Simkaniaceae bacterium]
MQDGNIHDCGSKDLRSGETPLAFMHLIHNDIHRVSKELRRVEETCETREGKKSKSSKTVPLFAPKGVEEPSDADYVYTAITGKVSGHYPKWIAFFAQQGETRDQAVADASVIVYKVLIPEVRTLYNELRTKPNGNDAVLRNVAILLGNLSPHSLTEPQTSSIRALIPSLGAYQRALVLLKRTEISLADGIASDTFQLENDLAYLKMIKEGKECDALENRIKQLEQSLSDARVKINGIGAHIVLLVRELTDLITSRFMAVCIPDAKPMSEAQFEREMERLEGQVAALKKSSDYRVVIADAHGLREITDLSRSIYDLNPELCKEGLLHGDPKNGFRNILGDRGPGIWFDASHILRITSPADFTEQLDGYFRQMARSGITSAKLSFARLNGNAKQVDTVATLFEKAEVAGVDNPMAVTASVAAEWGITLGISLGCGKGTTTLDFGSDPVASARAFREKYGRYCKGGIDVHVDGEVVARFLDKEGKDKVTAFFRELHTPEESENIPVQLTLRGSVGQNAEPLAFLFKEGYIDSVNVMAYDCDDCAFDDVGFDDSESVDWIEFFVDTCDIAPDEAMSMLHWGVEDALSYSDPSKTGRTDPDRSLNRGALDRVSTHLKEMDAGVAFSEEVEQLRIDTITEWNRKRPDQKLSSDARFGSQMWWVDARRLPGDRLLSLYPEAGAATRQIVRSYPF